MRELVLRYIRERTLIAPGDRVLAAVSGGADSVALLRVLLELRSEQGIVLAVAHFNHGLRGDDSDADEHFVVGLARQYELDFFAERQDVGKAAAARRMSLESAGRELRYKWLAKIAAEHRFDAVAAAHTLDDQAETVLMKFLRGAGSRGLAGIYSKMFRGGTEKVRFIRPLLGTTREEVESYLVSLDQPWREDESNLDHRFRRNRVRHDLLPLLEREYNPNLRQILSETAEINRAEEAYWNEAAGALLDQMRVDDRRLLLYGFAAIAAALQRRVLKQWLEDSEIEANFEHIEALRRCALGELPRAQLSNAWRAEREGDCVVLRRPSEEHPATGYQYRLNVPGEVAIPEIDCVLRVVPVPAAFAAEADPGTLLNADRIGAELWVRNWQPGDRYQPAYSGSERKLKRLFAEHKIAAPERPSWPVVLSSGEIVWVRGLPVGDAYCWRPGDGAALRIECVAMKTLAEGVPPSPSGS